MWQEQGKRSAQLLRGHELEQAEAWSARQPLEAPPLTPLQREYIAASRKSATRRQRYWVSGSALVSAFTAALVILAYVQKEAADASARDVAQADRRKAAELSAPIKAADLTIQQPGRALAYLARAIRVDPPDSGFGRRALISWQSILIFDRFRSRTVHCRPLRRREKRLSRLEPARPARRS